MLLSSFFFGYLLFNTLQQTVDFINELGFIGPGKPPYKRGPFQKGTEVGSFFFQWREVRAWNLSRSGEMSTQSSYFFALTMERSQVTSSELDVDAVNV